MRKVIGSVFSLFLASAPMAQSADSLEAEAEVEVEIIYPQQDAHKPTINLSGTIVAEQDAQLSSLEAGLVKSIYVEAGDKVESGQKLLSLDDTLTKLRLSQVEADHLSAQVRQAEALRQYNEVVSLAKRKVVSDSLLSERKAALASANAALSSTKAQVALQSEIVKRHTLSAPFGGVIAKRNVDVGEWIGQQSQIFQLVSSKSLRLVVDLPQEHISIVSQTQDAEVLVIPDVLPERQYRLKLSSIVAVSEPVSRTVQIRIDLPDNTNLIPGMSARAKFNLSSQSAQLTWLPKSALKRHPDGGNSVFTVKANKVKRHKITLVKSELDKVAVIGLP
ncbi:MAG: efflux RND transporter periplasmic adaptor subunit, partial [Kangiellaceae bacterium]|nr:efflux RND transporter periplasmic adaptor subunit [Kangiellaceae bacterium]